MQIRFSFLLACLLATTFLSASNNPTPQPYNSSILSCKLPPPTNFHVLELGPTSVTFEFIPYMDALQSRIRIYRTSDNVLLRETIVPAGLPTATIDSIPSNTSVYATINTVCENGGHGTDSERVEFLTPILELIVAGYTPEDRRVCIIPNAGVRCEFDAGPSETMTTFKIYNSSDARQFGVRYLYEGEKFQVSLESTGNAGHNFQFFCDVSSTVPCNAYQRIIVKYESSPGNVVTVAEIQFFRNPVTTTGYFQCFWLSSSCRIDHLVPLDPDGPADPPKKPIRKLEGNNYMADQIATASPNPFSQSLDVFPALTSAENIHLQLFNLSGQKVLDQQFPGGQEQCTLSTSSLSPGFYFLRIDADGEVQTLKVIKSE